MLCAVFVWFVSVSINVWVGVLRYFCLWKTAHVKKKILTIYFWQIMKKKPGQEKKTGKLDRNTQDLALTSTC